MAMLTAAKLLLPAALLASSLPQATAIVGGYPAPLDDYPWVVSLYKKGDLLDLKAPSCTGALIRSNALITAAGCAFDVDPQQGRVAIGHGATLTIHTWHRAIWPRGFSPYHAMDDLAVITFRGSHNVTTFPRLSESELLLGDVMTVLGPGSESGTESGPGTLRQVRIPLMDRAACANEMRSVAICANKFCGISCYPYDWSLPSNPGRQNPDPISNTDRGSPVVRDGAIVGVTSIAAPDPDKPCSPRSYSSMRKFVPFIRQAIAVLRYRAQGKNKAKWRWQFEQVQLGKNSDGDPHHRGYKPVEPKAGACWDDFITAGLIPPALIPEIDWSGL